MSPNFSHILSYSFDITDTRFHFRFGVSRVYHEQCGYALLDAQSMHDKMISTLKILPGGGLDPFAGKAKLVDPNLMI